MKRYEEYKLIYEDIIPILKEMDEPTLVEVLEDAMDDIRTVADLYGEEWGDDDGEEW